MVYGCALTFTILLSCHLLTKGNEWIIHALSLPSGISKCTGNTNRANRIQTICILYNLPFQCTHGAPRAARERHGTDDLQHELLIRSFYTGLFQPKPNPL